MLSKEEVIFQLCKYFQKKAEFYQVDLAFLFGSYARGLIKEESDVDVAVVLADKVISEEEIFKIVVDISVDLGYEIKTEVNVIPIFKDFRKTMLYYNAIVLGMPVYIGDKARYVQVYNQAIYEMDDFEIYGKRMQFEAAKNVLRRMRHG